MSKLRAVIFDMDGVIIDSEPIHYEVNKDLYNDLEIEVSEEEYETFIGVSNKDVWSKLKKKHGLEETVDELVGRLQSKNIKHLQNSDEKPITGLLPLLELLKKEGITIGLASSSPRRYIEAVLEKFDIEDYFNEMVSGANMERGKPYPDIFIKITNKMNLKPEECVVIEDSEKGVLAAKTAGLKCIGYLNPSSGNQDLSKADITVDSLEEITFKMLTGLI